MNGRQGRRENWMGITVCYIRMFYIRDFSDIICEVTFSETKIASTEFLTTGYVNLIVLRFLEISDSY